VISLADQRSFFVTVAVLVTENDYANLRTDETAGWPGPLGARRARDPRALAFCL
jgi:hypothetical protein